MGVCGIDITVSPSLECFKNSSDKPLATIRRLILAPSRETEHPTGGNSAFYYSLYLSTKATHVILALPVPAQNPFLEMLMLYFANF